MAHVAKENFWHNGVEAKKGEKVEFKGDDLKALLDSGLVHPADGKAEKVEAEVEEEKPKKGKGK